MKQNFKINARHILPALIFLAFTFVFINTAWLDDDIFITFRAVDNFLKGYGPVWNVGERVQVYTHPLWYFILVIGIGIFKHHYWFTLALSYACLLGTLFLLLKIMRHGNMALGILASVALLLSRAFADYSSSGLENPLLHLLLCTYVVVAITQADAAKRFLHASLLYSLLFLTRPDSIFLVTPASLWMLWQACKVCGWKRTLKLAAIAATPALAWEAFSLIYYGSLVPNTAIAKTNLGYPRSEMLARGWDYLKHSLRVDPITLGTMMLAAPISIFLGKSRLPQLLMVGVALQLTYICWVGGDYMMGRFLTTSMLASAIAIALSRNLTEKCRAIFYIIISASGIALFAFIAISHNITTNIRYAPHYPLTGGAFMGAGRSGAEDERAKFYPALGLLPVIKKHHLDPYTHPWAAAGFIAQKSGEPDTELAGNVGMTPWASGEKIHFIDYFALTDPFLARLPAIPGWRAGHYRRAIPKGYTRALVTGKNVVETTPLAALYEDVTLATRGSLFSKARWKSIWRLNTNHHKIQQGYLKEDSFGIVWARTFLNAPPPLAPTLPLSSLIPWTLDVYSLGAPPDFNPFAENASNAQDNYQRLKIAILRSDADAIKRLLSTAPNTKYFKTNLTQLAQRLWFLLVSEPGLDQETTLSKLLDAGVDADSRDSRGFPPIVTAAQLGNGDSVRTLLEHKADINAHSISGETALMGAAWGGHEDIINMLVNEGALINVVNGYGETALSFALQEKHMQAAKILLDSGADPDEALAPASWRGDMDAVEFLLAHGASINSTGGLAGIRWTPLMHAIAHNHRNLVDFLLSKGADINATDSKVGESPLYLALATRNLTMAEMLLDRGADVNLALMPASWLGNIDAANFLLMHGANINHTGGMHGIQWTPLMHAAYHGRTDMVIFLLRNGANASTVDPRGLTALKLATRRGHSDIVRILQQAGTLE